VYQEQVMQMAQVMGGYTLGGADLLRRAMGKKKPEEMARQRELFRKGAGERGVTEQTADEVFDLMEKFAGYGFNKSHAAAYSVVAYQTAYLKAHFPAEFMAAHLTNEASDSKKLSIALEEARRMDLALLPPCANNSFRHFSVEGENIRFGLYAVKGVGEGAIEAIVAERETGGPYSSLFDFCKRVDLRAVGKTVIEALVRAGAFDFCDAHRAQLAAAAEDAFRYGQQHQANKAMGQSSLFGGDGASGDDGFEPSLPVVETWTRGERLRYERELTGFYVSGHPLDAFDAEIRAFVTAQLGKADDIDASREHRLCGIITEVKTITTKAGKPMAFVTLEDQTGQGEVVLFTSVFERCSHLLKVDEVVMVRGPVEIRGGNLKVRANTLDPMWKVREQYVTQVVLQLDADATDADTLEALHGLCERNRGAVPVLFEVALRELARPIRLRARNTPVELTPELMQGLYRLVGREAVALEGDG
jgi:DNA polymerase III subunit alpha